MHQRGGGMMQFYEGFEAHLVGRLGYLAVRNTLYTMIYNATKPIKPFNDLSSYEKMWISGFAGGVAAYLTTPFTLISIRSILDSQIRPEWRRGYGNVSLVDAVKSLGA